MQSWFIWVKGIIKLFNWHDRSKPLRSSKPSNSSRQQGGDVAFPLVPPSSNLEGKTLHRRIGIFSESTRSLVDPKSDAPSCTHDGIAPICAHCSGLWLACFVGTPQGVVTLWKWTNPTRACPRPWFRGYAVVSTIPWEAVPHDARGIRLPPVECPNEGSFTFIFCYIKFNRDIWQGRILLN